MFEKAKPMEPGCLAWAFSLSYGVWRQVVVIKYVGSDLPFRSISSVEDFWLISEPMPWEPAWEPYWPTDRLIRIDDPDIQKQIESEREKEHA